VGSPVSTALLTSFFVHLAADLLAILIVAFAIYFRRHSRRDLLMIYTTLNVGLFVAMTVISLQETAIGVGFGLFAILSIIRIRSEEFTNSELAYAFISLIIALVNSLGVADSTPTLNEGFFILVLNVLAIAVVFVMDHPRLLRKVGHQQIILDTIHSNDQSLRADLEKRLNVRVLDYVIANVDYVREITVLNVRYATDRQI
jgi:hypothetical protein